MLDFVVKEFGSDGGYYYAVKGRPAGRGSIEARVQLRAMPVTIARLATDQMRVERLNVFYR